MEAANKLEKLLDHLKEYAETRYQIGILNVQGKLSIVLSSLASKVILGILILFVLLFGGIGTALWLGVYFDNTFIGYFYVAGFYFLILLIIFFNREKWIKSPVMNDLIKKINFDEEN